MLSCSYERGACPIPKLGRKYGSLQNFERRLRSWVIWWPGAVSAAHDQPLELTSNQTDVAKYFHFQNIFPSFLSVFLPNKKIFFFSKYFPPHPINNHSHWVWWSNQTDFATKRQHWRRDVVTKMPNSSAHIFCDIVVVALRGLVVMISWDWDDIP